MSRPNRSAGNAIPLARLTIAAQVLMALVVAYFLFTATGVRIPFVDRTYTVEAFVPDAAGLQPSNRPLVTVAGVKAGSVKSVTYDTRRRRARIVLRLDAAVRGKLFADASIGVVPRSALNDLVVNIQPGSPATGPLRGDTVITAAPAPVGADRPLGVLDADTRAYTQILAGTLNEVLRDRPGDLRDAVHRLPTVTSTVNTLAAQLASRRRHLSRLVTDLDRIISATASRSTQLTAALSAARRTLVVSSRRQDEVQQTVAALPGTLTQANAAFGSLDGLGRPLVPALDGLQGTVRGLPAALTAVRGLLPTVRSTTQRLDDLTRRGRAPLAALRSAATALGPVSRQLRPVPRLAAHTVQAVVDNEPGFSRILDFWPGTLSSQNRIGVLVDFSLLEVHANPRMLGLPGGSTGAANGRIAGLVRALRKRNPRLFDLPASLRRQSAPLTGVAALVNGLCSPKNPGACLLLSILAKNPPKVQSR
jgi:phospholipid/cholesterol/gamma-HCH transport system substrate-binding protein